MLRIDDAIAAFVGFVPDEVHQLGGRSFGRCDALRCFSSKNDLVAPGFFGLIHGRITIFH